VHGIVYARGKVGGRDVAYVHARSTYMHEADSAIGFRELNSPRYLTGPGRFRRAAAKIDFTFNWFYAGRRHIAYQQSGWYPVRAPGTSPDFPILGGGRYDWRGYRPGRHLSKMLSASRHPHATDRRYLVSWNNRPAPRFSGADDDYAYGPVFRSQLLSEKVTRMIRGPRTASAAGLVRAMAQAATQDLRAHELLPIVLRALGHPSEPKLASARATLAAWGRAGAYRRDLDANGHDEHTRAIELWDAWYPRLVRAEFHPTLKNAFFHLRRMIDIGTHVGGDSFFGGWFGYVSKDLRGLFGSHPPRGAFSRTYCGGGSRARCRAALRASLRSALIVTPQQLYGQGDCTADPEPACADRNTFLGVGAIDEPPFPFQNRPTFQQVVGVRGG